MSTALIACFIDIVIDQISIRKYTYLKEAVDKNVLTGDLYVPYLKYAMVSAIPVAIGSFLVAYVEVNSIDSFFILVKFNYLYVFFLLFFSLWLEVAVYHSSNAI